MFLSKSKIYLIKTEKGYSIHSVLGHTDHCLYEDGRCSLDAGDLLVWKPVPHKIDNYILMKKREGIYYHHLEIWISHSGEFSLSFKDDLKEIDNNGQNLIISNHGYS